jgi:ABC-type glycerol-3-phosphate transport system permease component
MFKSSKLKANIVKKRWAEFFPSNFKLKWSNTWDKHCSKKELSFIRTIWNKVVVVNVWVTIVDPVQLTKVSHLGLHS